MKLEQKQFELLGKALPSWAIKKHPTKVGMNAIHPMAIIDRLNEVFEIGGWSFTTEFISCDQRTQKTKNGDRLVFDSAVKGRLEIPSIELVIEQYGGSTNEDKGDALKGGATDSLTKIASYLGIGAEIYKGRGNIDNGSKETVSDERPEEVAWDY